jgi:uncharacterized protein (DUF1697 family)
MRYAAFLRAVNVGKHNRIGMADLREAMERDGLKKAQTYLQSGNVWFDSPGPDAEALTRQLEALLVSLGCKGADVMLRSVKQMQAITTLEPFTHTSANHYLLVVFLRQPLAEAIPGHPRLEVVHSTGSEVFLQLDKSVPLHSIKAILKTTTLNTTRYWKVVQEVCERMQG